MIRGGVSAKDHLRALGVKHWLKYSERAGVPGKSWLGFFNSLSPFLVPYAAMSLIGVGTPVE